jgi:signal transduction histidine kinase
MTNHTLLMRTLRELLFNAAKYSDGQHITLHVTKTETAVCFVVEDVGPGLGAESEELIFKPFMKVDDLSEGLGLGLPLSRSHALRLGGNLTYDSSYHEGCRFILEIPK